MGFKTLMAACAATTVWLGAGGANATVITVQGTVAAGYDGPAIDTEGLFGTMGASLVGDAFTAVIHIDDSSATGVNNSGGQYSGYGTTIVDLTIGGQTVEKSLSSGWEIGNWESPCEGCQQYYIVSNNQHVTVEPYHVYDYLTVYYVNGPYGAVEQQAGFYFDSGAVSGVLEVSQATADPLPPVDIRPLMGVPEPATWMMLILGLGLIGLAVRTREDVAAAA